MRSEKCEQLENPHVPQVSHFQGMARERMDGKQGCSERAGSNGMATAGVVGAGPHCLSSAYGGAHMRADRLMRARALVSDSCRTRQRISSDGPG